MVILTTRTGRTIECDAVVAGRATPYLHVHTSALSFVEAASIFSDEEETAVLQAERQNDEQETVETDTYRGFTSLYAIQQSPFIPEDFMIWLNRPFDVNEG